MKTRSQISKNSVAKGNSFQNQIAKLLGAWWCHDPKAFHSTPRSGGLRWHADQQFVGGDVVTARIDWPFYIECKNRQDWSLDQVMHRKGPVFSDWIPKVEQEAHELEKDPLLIMRLRNHGIYCILWDLFLRVWNTASVSWYHTLWDIPPAHIRIYQAEQQRYLYLLDFKELLDLNQGINLYEEEVA